jgi:hypothetical protein
VNVYANALRIFLKYKMEIRKHFANPRYLIFLTQKVQKILCNVSVVGGSSELESRKKRDSYKTNYISEKSQLCSAALYQGRGMTLLDYKRRLRENSNFVFFWGTIAVFL